MVDGQMINDIRFNELLFDFLDFQLTTFTFIYKFGCLVLELVQKIGTFFSSFKPNLLSEYVIFLRCLWMDLGVESILYDGYS